MKDNVNLFNHSKKLFYTIMECQYDVHERGYLDFPSKAKWLNEEWEIFKSNNTDLLGLKYDKTDDSWVYEYEGGLVRTILKRK